MHNPLSPAMEAVTLFAANASVNGTVTAERQHIEHLAKRLGLGPAQLCDVLEDQQDLRVSPFPAWDPRSQGLDRTALPARTELEQPRPPGGRRATRRMA